MRTWHMTITAAVSLLTAAACGGSSNDNTGAADSPAPRSSAASSLPLQSASPTTPGVDVNTLKGALLTVDDFPTGWKTTPVTDSDDSTTSGDCGQKLEAFDKEHPDAKVKAESDFERKSDEINEELQAHPDPSALRAQVAEYANIITGCTTLILKNDGETIKLDVGVLSFPKLGDSTLAYSASGKVEGVSIEINKVLIQRGAVLLQLTQASVFSADAELLTATATKALAKLDAKVPPTRA